MTARRARGDRGGTLVEFAILAPILFLMMFALADFALAELSDTAGANAAREGARVGILHYEGAHAAGPNKTKITDAVVAKLARNVKGTPAVTVRCLDPDGDPRRGTGTCSSVPGDPVAVGEDLIEVSVTWTRKIDITGFIGNPTRTDVAVMRIVGTPPAGAASPSACELTAGTATPDSVVQSGGAIPAVNFEVTVNDPALCGSPLLDLTGVGTLGVETMLSSGPTTFEFLMPAGQGTWTSGTKTFTATANGGAVTRDISFEVLDPAVCLITTASASPSTVTQSGGTLSSAVTFTVTVSDAGVCSTPTLTFPVNAGYAAPRTMGPAGGNTFTFVLPVGQGTWANQTYNVIANAGSSPSATVQLVVSAAPVCGLSNLTISPTVASVKKTGQNEIQADVTIRITRSSLTACGVPNITVTPGNSGPTGSATDLTTPKPMRNVGSSTGSCNAVTCEWVIADGTRNWLPAPSTRTVTVTASGATVTGTLNLT